MSRRGVQVSAVGSKLNVGRAPLAGLWVLLALTAGCSEITSDGDDVTPAGTITLEGSATVELPPVANQSRTLTFKATAAWTATSQAEWVVVTPKSGTAGTHTLTLTTGSTNRTKGRRTAQLSLRTDKVNKYVTVVQSGQYAVFDQKEYSVGAEGGTLSLGFTTNIERDEQLQIMYTQQDWVHWQSDARHTRTDYTGYTPTMSIDPNPSADGRTAIFALAMPTTDGDWMGLDTTYVYQAGVRDDYESADFSADGTVVRLQQATEGRGISIVLMGDGFTDRDIADSTYIGVMRQTMENLFSEEPVSSLRHYFNVHMVNVVSANGGVGTDRTTALSTVPSTSSTGIDFDEDQVLAYTERVADIDLEQALTVVISNSHSHNGVTALLVNPSTGRPRQYAIALCTVIDSVQSETFRQVLVHEAIGHGLAKLADEYGYEGNGTVPQQTASDLATLHRNNWMLNVDTTDDEQSVLWSQFIGDSRFSNEQIGVYEGAYTYVLGAYRPTENSMMNSNRYPFNAPSRKAIYDRILKLGEGRSASTVDEFATFDAQHKPQRWDYTTAATRSLPQWQQPRPTPPLLLAR